MKLPLPLGSTIGILGGGQLGRMLAMAAARLGYRTAILAPEMDAPAVQVANTYICADYEDSNALDQLVKVCDVVTYEFENVPVAAARSISERVPVRPSPESLEVSQDRLTEKIFLNDSGVATAPFLPVDTDMDLARGLAAFRGRGVLKTRRMGYDGKGQRVFREAKTEDIMGCYAQMGNVPLILEGLVEFSCEASIIAARSVDGEMIAYDAAENEHRGGILFRSTAPARIPDDTVYTLQDKAFTILSAIDYVGVIGVEFFILKDGAVLVNEIAPRVHNSGHWTEAACAVSQFEQHIRAVAGLPLGRPDRHSDCVMENLLGSDLNRAAKLLRQPNVVLHLYGKTEARPGRKMGHFTRLTARRTPPD